MVARNKVTRARCLPGAALVASLAAGPASAGTYTVLYAFQAGAGGNFGPDGGEPGGVIQDRLGNLYGETLTGGVSCDSAVDRNEGCGTVFKLDPAGTLTTLVTFKGHNGASGASPLTLLGSTLYGEAQKGGADAQGLLFSVGTDGTKYTVLHNFIGTDGSGPTGGLRAGPNNVGYGVTINGGTGSAQSGVLFEIKANGTFIVLHNFTGGTDGASPNNIIVAPSGTIFGSTNAGGIDCPTSIGVPGCGVVFQYVPSTGVFTILHSFVYTDGQNPILGSLGADGRLYGATRYGGSIGCGNNCSGYGTLFSLGTVAGNTQFTNLVNFNNNAGAQPTSGPVLNPDGSLTGVTAGGSTSDVGTFYNDSGSALVAVYSFGSNTAGGFFPLAQPIPSGSTSFIGTTQSGGPTCSCGTIYRYTP